MIYTKFEKCPITKVKVVVLHPVQQAMVILGKIFSLAIAGVLLRQR